MPRHVFNLLGVVNDIEHVLRGEGDNASADVLARYVRSHLDVLDVPSRAQLAQVAEQLDELRGDIAALASWMDADMDDVVDDADEDGGDDGSTRDAVPTARRVALDSERGGARATRVEGAAAPCKFTPAFKDAKGEERSGSAVARRGAVVPAAARGGSGARRATVRTRGTRKK